MNDSKKEKWSISQQFSDAISLIKKVGFRSYLLPSLNFLLAGLVFIALSFYKSIVSIGFIFLLFISFLSFQNVLETSASMHLEERVKFSFSKCFTSYVKTHGHLIITFVKTLILTAFFSFILMAIVTLIMYIADKSLIDSLTFYLNSGIEANNSTQLFNSDIYPILYLLYDIMALCFALSFISCLRKNQHIQSYMMSQVNIDRETFLYSPAPLSYGGKIHKKAVLDINKDLYFINLISVAIIALGIALGTFLGHLFAAKINTFSPIAFGLGLGLVLYSFWYGIKFNITTLYFYKDKEEKIDYIPQFLKPSFEQYREELKTIVEKAKELKDEDVVISGTNFTFNKAYLVENYFYTEKTRLSFEVEDKSDSNLGVFGWED